jgi:hypothetical protein
MIRISSLHLLIPIIDEEQATSVEPEPGELKNDGGKPVKLPNNDRNVVDQDFVAVR